MGLGRLRWPSLATVLLAALLGRPEVAVAAPPCNEACYQAKSQAYQRCRAIPPADRAARVACFQRADAALQSCLRRCK